VRVLSEGLSGNAKNRFVRDYDRKLEDIETSEDLEERGELARDLDNHLIQAARRFLETKLTSGSLDPAVYFHLTDEETAEEKMERLGTFLRGQPSMVGLKLSWNSYDSEANPASRLNLLLDFSRKVTPHILTIDDALINLKVPRPPRPLDDVRSPEEKLTNYLRKGGYLKGDGSPDLATYLESRLSTIEKATYEVMRSVNPESDMLIEGAEDGLRLVKPFIRNQLWSETGSFVQIPGQNGRRVVRRVFNPEGLLGAQGSLFVKKFPELPGMEAAARNAVLGLFGQGVPYSDVFNMNEWPYQVSQGFEHPEAGLRGDLLEVKDNKAGELIRERLMSLGDGTINEGLRARLIAEEKNSCLYKRFKELTPDEIHDKEWQKSVLDTCSAVGEAFLKEQIKKLDPESTSALIIASLLLNPEDAKMDNFVFSQTEDGGLQLVSVDNDHILAPTVGDPVIQAENRQGRLTEIYSYLFRMGGADYGNKGPMDWTVDPSAVAIFREKSGGNFFDNYLTGLRELEARYGRLFATAGGELSGRHYFANHYDSCVCIPLNRSMANLFYDNLCRLGETLESFQVEELTHKKLLERLNPILARGDRLSKTARTSSSVRAMTQAYGYGSMKEVFKAARDLPAEIETIREAMARFQTELSQTKNTYKKETAAERDAHRLSITEFEQILRGGHLSQFQIVQFLRHMDMGVMTETEVDQTTLRNILNSLQNPRNPLSRVILQNCGLLHDGDFVVVPAVPPAGAGAPAVPLRNILSRVADRLHGKPATPAGAGAPAVPPEPVTGFNLRNLYHLEIPGCTRIKKAFIDRIAKEAPSLRKLDISRLDLGEDFTYKLPLFLKLEELIMEDVTSLRNLNITSPDLRKLVLKGCTNLSNGLLNSIKFDCPSLVSLDLRGISRFNSNMFDDLIASGTIRNKAGLVLKLEGTGLDWPEIMEIMPMVRSDLFKRLKGEFSKSVLFSGTSFIQEGLDTCSDTKTNLQSAGYVGGSIGIGVAAALISGPIGWGILAGSGLILGISYGVTKAKSRFKLQKSLQESEMISSRTSGAVVTSFGQLSGNAAFSTLAELAAEDIAARAAQKALESSVTRAAVTEGGEQVAQQVVKQGAIKAAQVAARAGIGAAGGALSFIDVVTDEVKRNNMAKRFLGVILAKGIMDNNRLETLRVPKSNLGDSGIEPIAKALEANTVLKTLDLSECGMGDEGAGHLTKALERNTVLTHLNLRNNKISEAGAVALLASLQTNTVLTHLSLDGNKTWNPLRSDISEGTRGRIRDLLQRNNDMNREHTQALSGERDGQNFSFMVGDHSDLGALDINKLTAMRMLRHVMVCDPISKVDIEGEATRAALQPLDHIKKALGGQGLPLRGRVLKALARSMETAFHFWMLQESSERLSHCLSLNTDAPDHVDFLLFHGQEFFTGAKHLQPHSSHALNTLSLSIRPDPVMAGEGMAGAGGGRPTGERVRYGLSIDGGGMRGLIPAIMLSRIEAEAKEYKPSFTISDAFDYVGGTSVGGILALGLTIDSGEETPILSCSDLEGLFTTHGKDIFGTRTGLGLLRSKYSPETLQDILRGRFGDTTLASALKPVLVTSANITSEPFQPGLFNSAVESHGRWPVWQVARATSAAPTFFPHAEFPCPSRGNLLRLWDGGVWVNNPARLVYDNLVKYYNVQDPRKKVRILSLGTGDLVAEYAPPSGHGVFQAVYPLIYGQMDLAVGGVHDGMIHALGADYRRIQPTVTNAAGRLLKAQMDDFRPETLERYRQSVEDMNPEITYVVEEWIRPSLEAQ
jgi:hypothetical protein